MTLEWLADVLRWGGPALALGALLWAVFAARAEILASLPKNRGALLAAVSLAIAAAAIRLSIIPAWTRHTYDGHEAERRKFGWTSATVLTDAGDPTHVVVVGKVKSLAQAKDFTNSASLKETMKKIGVISAPDIAFLKVVEQKAY